MHSYCVLSPEKFLGQLIDALAVCASTNSWHQLLLDLTSILNLFGSDFLDGDFDQGANFIFTKALGQKPLENLQLCVFPFGQLCPSAFSEEINGFSSLLAKSC